MSCPQVPFKVFVVAGMPRSGTTFLYHNLQKHPSVYLPFRKETNYFSFDYGKGADWYRHLYREIAPGEIGADISPSYFMHHEAIERIKKFDREIKVVLGVRDPADWALSFYSQILTYSWRVPPFAEFLDSFLWQVEGQELLLVLRNGFVTRMIEDWRHAFGDDLLLYDFNLFQRDRLAVLRAIERFVGIRPYFAEGNFDNIVINASKRRNVRAITHLLTRSGMVSLWGAILPRRWLHFLRRLAEKLSQGQEHRNTVADTPENIQLAKAVFAAEGAAIKKLFAAGGIQLGSGAVFPNLLADGTLLSA